jgi:hypothetical protein
VIKVNDAENEQLSEQLWTLTMEMAKGINIQKAGAQIKFPRLYKAWHQKTQDRLTADGLTGAEFESAFTIERQAYFDRPRSRCVCGDHLPDGLSS